uniref:Os02g0159700 protein n=1 Tax=Macrostomum lignano TaxID=282301 RepID=A0A1I8JNX9_9PLAT
PLVRNASDPDVDAYPLPAGVLTKAARQCFKRPEGLKFFNERDSTPEPQNAPPRTYSRRPDTRSGSIATGGSAIGLRARSIHMSPRIVILAGATRPVSRSRLCVPIPLPVILRLPPQPPRRVHDRIGGRRVLLRCRRRRRPRSRLSPLAGGQNQRRFRRRPIAERLGVRPVKNFAESGGGRGGKFDSNRLYYRPPPAAALDPLATRKRRHIFCTTIEESAGLQTATDTVGAGAAAAVFRRGGGRFGGFRGGGGGGIEGKWQHDKFVDDEDEAMVKCH